MSNPEGKEADLLGEAELVVSYGRQSVRLPFGFRIEGERVKIRRTPEGILLEAVIVPRPRRTAAELQAMWDLIDSSDADPLFPDGRNQGIVEPEQIFD